MGTPWVKPTRLLSPTELLDDVALRCLRNHARAKLKGKVWDPERQKMVFKTKLAQVYGLCVLQLLMLWLWSLLIHLITCSHLLPWHCLLMTGSEPLVRANLVRASAGRYSSQSSCCGLRAQKRSSQATA